MATMQTKDLPKRGRSPGYDVEIAETICARIAEGESLRAICADPRMPAKATVCRWLARNQEFRRRYAIARESLAEDLVDEILEIVDARVVDRNHIARQRLRIATCKSLLARLAPNKYGNCQSQVLALDIGLQSRRTRAAVDALVKRG